MSLVSQTVVIERKKREDVEEKKSVYKWDIVWTNVLIMGTLHAGAIYGFFFMLSGLSPSTKIFAKIYNVASTFGITGGAHRLWCHRTYKARWPVQVILMTLATMTYQNSIYTWCRDHRLHHKCSETDGDPHNAKRGFFFSHVGWLLVRKHDEVKRIGKTIDMSDLEANPIVMFQHKYYYYLVFLMALVVPTFVPWYFFGEDLTRVFFGGTMYGYTLGINLIWCTNSLAHLYGKKPYDKNIGPTSHTFMRFIALGEGFHNYHHTFPWDYKSAEMSFDFRNMTTVMIDGFAKLGWVTDRKTVPESVIEKRMARTGDGSTLKPSDKPFLGISMEFWFHCKNLLILTIWFCYIL